MNGRIRSCARRMASRSSISGGRKVLCAQKVSNGHPLVHGPQFGDEVAKTLRENVAAPRQIKSNPRARDVMMQEIAPTGPELRIEQTVNVMVVNRFERFQKLMGRVEEEIGRA